MYSSSNQIAAGIGSIIGGIVVGIIFGFITKHINESKGYEGGFAWGFWLSFIGIIVVACKPDNRAYSQMQNQNISNLSNQGWSTADELKKYKELMDQGVITQTEFQAKKEQLLKDL